MHVNIIGAGKLGKTLAVVLSEQPAITRISVVNQTLESAKQATTGLANAYAYSNIEELSPADLTLITTPDASIGNICTKLCQKDKIKAGSTVFHCSGYLDEQILSDARDQSAYIACLHPFFSFSSDLQTAVTLFKSSVYCSLSGDAQAKKLIQNTFMSCHIHYVPIDSMDKKKYHAAACMSSNYLVTLFSNCMDVLEEAQIPSFIVKQMVYQMMSNTLSNIQANKDIRDALTGPIQRGDVDTIAAHLEVLSPKMHKLYRVLGSATLSLTHLSTALMHKIKGLLD